MNGVTAIAILVLWAWGSWALCMWVIRSGETRQMVKTEAGSSYSNPQPDATKPKRLVRDVLIEPSPNIFGLPENTTIDLYVSDGMKQLKIFMVQQSRK